MAPSWQLLWQHAGMRSWLPVGFESCAEIEVRRSRFLATVARAEEESAARAMVARVKAAFPDARHHCLAFIIDVPGAQPIERSSDDGEPAGTAGMPMLEVLRGAGLGNVVAVVTRYFGGTLLGTGGLVRAYSDAVASALVGAPRLRPELRMLWGVDVPTADAGRVQGALRNRGIDIRDTTWGSSSVVFTLAVVDQTATLPVIREIVRADVRPQPLGVTTVEVPL